MLTITIQDETSLGTATGLPFTLEVPSESTTVRELIALRVQHEVERFNTAQIDTHQMLVQRAALENPLNAATAPRRKLTLEDAEKQTYLAWAAFQQHQFFVIADDRQAETLDQPLALHQDSAVSFLRLTPLVGG